MELRFTPPKDVQAQRQRIGGVPTLVLRPRTGPLRPVAVLWLHGGGYILGMKEMVYFSRALDLLRSYGVTVFSPGYRLAWLHPYPAPLEDCVSVLQSIHQARQELGIREIMVGGESAGGGLCSALCMKARELGIPVAFQMPLYPMLSIKDTSSSQKNHGRIWNTWKNHFAWRIFVRGKERKQVSPYASPALQTDYRNLPPCYTFVGDGEPFYRETLDYVENLRAAGVWAKADVYPTNIHAFDLFDFEPELKEKAKKRFLEVFEEALSSFTES